MTTMTATFETQPIANDFRDDLYIVHPLDDIPEVKRSADGLGLMPMTPSVKFWLAALRGYLILVTLLAVYRVICLAGH